MADNTPLTHAPDPVRLGTGAGTAAAQEALPRLYANYTGGGWADSAPAPATAVTAGTPGTWSAPSNPVPPDDFAGMPPVGAIPLTPWTSGQSTPPLGDGSYAYWSGSAWVAGKAP